MFSLSENTLTQYFEATYCSGLSHLNTIGGPLQSDCSTRKSRTKAEKKTNVPQNTKYALILIGIFPLGQNCTNKGDFYKANLESGIGVFKVRMHVLVKHCFLPKKNLKRLNRVFDRNFDRTLIPWDVLNQL